MVANYSAVENYSWPIIYGFGSYRRWWWAVQRLKVLYIEETKCLCKTYIFLALMADNGLQDISYSEYHEKVQQMYVTIPVLGNAVLIKVGVRTARGALPYTLRKFAFEIALPFL